MWRSRLVAIGFGVLGIWIGLLCWHAYRDHQQLHILIEYVNLQAPKINRLPAIAP